MTKSQILSKEVFASTRNRLALVQFLTRFGEVEWHVTDAAVLFYGIPDVVYQGDEAGARAYIKREEDAVEAQEAEAWAAE